MLLGLAHKPYQHMAVEYHVFKLEFLFVFVLVDEGCLKLAFLSDIEFLDLDLFGKVHTVL